MQLRLRPVHPLGVRGWRGANRDPGMVNFMVGALDRGPGDSMSDHLALAMVAILFPSMVEGLAINGLRRLGQRMSNGRRQILNGGIWHDLSLPFACICKHAGQAGRIRINADAEFGGYVAANHGSWHIGRRFAVR